ncbi:SRPBCC domain-containing protein [Micromonospora sp. NPDC049559]|uniref:SRPBCC domain-containing protein n=1 Tax=Micromonospora sp. NPDC049559 TaxID=3155923 RepID=UPI00342F9963
MTEIRTAVDLQHPAGRAWRALTDRRLLPQWFAPTDLEPEIGAQFRFEPLELPGIPGPIEGEVTELDEPHRIVMRWYEGDVQSLVIYDLRPRPEGCQLVLREYCEDGEWPPETRDLREQTFEGLLTGRLPAVLDWLAFREVDLADETPADEPTTAEIAAGQSRRRRRIAALAAVGVVLVGGAAVAGTVWGGGGSPQATSSASASAEATSDGGDAPATTSAAPSRTPRSPSPSASPTASATPKPSKSAAGAPARAVLSGRYATVADELADYTGEVVISNSGRAAGTGWTVTITLAGGAKLKGTSGASGRQDGRTATFSGAAVPAGGTLRFTFTVESGLLGAKQPQGCAVNGQRCAGL